MKKTKPGPRRGISHFFIGLFRRFFITVQMFGQNGMANHAAAGAYGFLLSAAPALIIVSFFLYRILQASPETAAKLIADLFIFEGVYDARELIEQFVSSSKPGISGIVSVVSIIWAARVFALSMIRGIKVVFADTRAGNPVRDFVITFIIELGVILFAIIWILNSQLAVRLYELLGDLFPQNQGIINTILTIGKYLPLAGVVFITYLMFRIIPENPPGQKPVIQGTLVTVVLFFVVSYALRYILNPARYSVIYGALGSLIMLLANVYFFFIFFYYGAQFAFVVNSYDALIFSRLCRKFQVKSSKYNTEKITETFKQSTLRKYIRYYKTGDTVFNRGDKGREVYYIVSGEAGVFLDDSEKQIAVIHPGGFFGEMEFLFAEKRNARIIAITDLIVIQMQPSLFNEILKIDPSMDRWVIESISKQLKNANEKIIAAAEFFEPES